MRNDKRGIPGTYDCDRLPTQVFTSEEARVISPGADRWVTFQHKVCFTKMLVQHLCKRARLGVLWGEKPQLLLIHTEFEKVMERLGLYILIGGKAQSPESVH